MLSWADPDVTLGKISLSISAAITALLSSELCFERNSETRSGATLEPAARLLQAGAAGSDKRKEAMKGPWFHLKRFDSWCFSCKFASPFPSFRDMSPSCLASCGLFSHKGTATASPGKGSGEAAYLDRVHQEDIGGRVQGVDTAGTLEGYMVICSCCLRFCLQGPGGSILAQPFLHFAAWNHCHSCPCNRHCHVSWRPNLKQQGTNAVCVLGLVMLKGLQHPICMCTPL